MSPSCLLFLLPMKPCPSTSFFRVAQASYGVHDPFFAVTQLAQTSMRSEIGKMTLDRTVALGACKDTPSSLFKWPHGLVKTSFPDVSGLVSITTPFLFPVSFGFFTGPLKNAMP